MDIVLDASVAARALMPGDAELLGRLRRTPCHAPHLIDAEVSGVLRRAVAGGRMAAHTAEAGLHALGTLVDDRYPHSNLVAAAWQLRGDVSYYDALYVALATRLGYTLFTADARLARAPGLPCTVELID